VPHLVFAPTLERRGTCPSDFAIGVTLRALLDDYLSRHADVRPQLLDETGRLHQNVLVLIDGRQLVDREKLSDPVAAASEVYVMQASSDDGDE
jgi:molybdopterin synthase sulfur carrier subunit